MQDLETLKKEILAGTIAVYAEKGVKFTMDDLAKQLGMSKKTIYLVYREKKTLFMAMVDYVFDSIKVSEQEVIDDPTTTTVEKIRKILGVLPDSYKSMDLGQLYILREKYPELDLVTLIGSVRDSRKMFQVFDKYRPDVVYHAAAGPGRQGGSPKTQ